MSAFYDDATTRQISEASLAIVRQVEERSLTVAEAHAGIDELADRYPGAERQQRYYGAMKNLIVKVRAVMDDPQLGDD